MHRGVLLALTAFAYLTGFVHVTREFAAYDAWTSRGLGMCPDGSTEEVVIHGGSTRLHMCGDGFFGQDRCEHVQCDPTCQTRLFQAAKAGNVVGAYIGTTVVFWLMCMLGLVSNLTDLRCMHPFTRRVLLVSPTVPTSLLVYAIAITYGVAAACVHASLTYPGPGFEFQAYRVHANASVSLDRYYVTDLVANPAIVDAAHAFWTVAAAYWALAAVHCWDAGNK